MTSFKKKKPGKHPRAVQISLASCDVSSGLQCFQAGQFPLRLPAWLLLHQQWSPPFLHLQTGATYLTPLTSQEFAALHEDLVHQAVVCRRG